MNLFCKQFRQHFVPTLLLVLLLTVGIAFSSIGCRVWGTVQKQLKDLDEQYTTIAVPVQSTKGFMYEEGQSEDEEDNITSMRKWYSFQTEQDKSKCPGFLAEEKRGFLLAHVPGCESVSPYARDYFSNYLYDSDNLSMMVLAVECTLVEDMTDPNSVYSQAILTDDYELAGYEEVYDKHYWAEFALKDVVCRSTEYEAIPNELGLSLNSQLYTESGEIPFEVGKTYLIFGVDRGLSPQFGDLVDMEIETGEIIQVTEEELHEMFATDHTYNAGANSAENALGKGNQFFSWEKRIVDGNGRYFVPSEDSLPFCAEYEGDWREFLDSEEGKVWREEIIPWCELNYETSSVILSDNLDTMYWFNNGTADILEGRMFEKEEYTQGEAVCMVSSTYAAKNNLSVGDAIRLDFYRSDLTYAMDISRNVPDETWNVEPILTTGVCKEEKRIGVEKDYTIVGIYTAPEFSTGWHSFQADTIFVPKASVPDVEQYEMSNIVLLYSLILENGTEEKFDQYITEQGYGGLFVYSDQGYREAVESFQALAANAMRLALAGFAVFVLTGVLFLFLNFRRVFPVIRNMRLLGIRAKVVWKELLEVLAALIGISAIAGAGLGYALYGTVTAQVLEKSIAVSPWMMLLCAAVLAVVLLLAAAVTAKVQTGKKLMSKRKKK